MTPVARSSEGWDNLPTEFGVVGVYDGTTVTINPTQDVTFGGNNYPAGQNFTVSLDRFQTLQVQSAEDLTGSRITSSHPVSVLSGNLFTVIGNNQDGSGDYIVVMMPPVDTWGKEFVTAPLAKRTAGDIFRVVAARDNTTVTVTGRNPRNLDAGQFWEFEAGSNEYLHVTSNEPVLKTGDADNTNTDPFSMIIPPVAQFEADYTFSTVELINSGTTHYVNLVIQSSDKAGLIFDGQPLPGSTVWHPVPGTTYEATDLTISAGTHTATHSSPIATFGLFSYGFASAEAYGYPGGLRLAQIGGACTPTPTVANDRVDNDCDGRVDEELRNGIDDDGDGLIDEDIASGGDGTDVGRRPIFQISTIYPFLPQGSP
ncbi:IgGFc-binding protein-like [Branchiostoma floridae x Branchiostoma belcheri]